MKFFKVLSCLTLAVLSVSVFAADWEHEVSQLLFRHGFQLPPSKGDGALRALEIGAGKNPVSRDQFSLDQYEKYYSGVHLPNMIDANADRVPLPANSLDVIFAHNVPDMFSAVGFLTEADRLLRPGGVFIVIGSVHEVMDSLEWRLVQYTKSTLTAHAKGYELIDLLPGDLKLPNAPMVDGFVFVKPADRAKAESNIENPKWQIPKVLKTWELNGRLCAEDLESFEYHRQGNDLRGSGSGDR